MSFEAGALPTPVAKRALNQGSAYLRGTRGAAAHARERGDGVSPGGDRAPPTTTRHRPSRNLTGPLGTRPDAVRRPRNRIKKHPAPSFLKPPRRRREPRQDAARALVHGIHVRHVGQAEVQAATPLLATGRYSSDVLLTSLPVTSASCILMLTSFDLFLACRESLY